MAYGLHCLAVLLLYLCLQCNQGTARPLPEYIGLGLSEQSDWKILSPSSFIVDAASALGKSTTKQTDDEQDRDSVLTFEEASGYSGHIKGLFDDLELSGEFSGDDDLELSGEFSGDGVLQDNASQIDSPSELFPPTDEVLFSDALAWDITSKDVVDQLFFTFQTFSGGEKRLEQALWAEFLDSSSGASSQSDIEIVDIEGSGEIEDDAAASYTEMTDAFYRDETAHVISESVPTARGDDSTVKTSPIDEITESLLLVPTTTAQPQGDCLGQCDDSTVKTSPIDEITESLLLVATTTTEPKTQISPPASWSAIKDYVDSSASGDGSDLDTDDLDENTPTVAETQVTFQGATALDRQDVPAEGNSTIPVPGA
ncbi:uncharacterized protein LOC121690000 isoform X1 [Alosa sapidissima]|uniref:uncharacterized protein LOC121690000 isoform X1 n=1 Tax=Alosa sapidissima TaxID=34773 RepID=UPI001C08AD33|nr:uncharacterized protein LOC121690000 isoform X1 [Alosa sapidissima]